MNTQTISLDWKEYIEKARQVTAEGCVLLENKDSVLPFGPGTKIAVFGRIQNHYYKSGTGSGGMVNVQSVIGIVDGLKKSGRVIIDKELENTYLEWEKINPYEEGVGWGKEPWCQKEMEVSPSLASETAKRNDVALVIIGRTAGEDKDNKNESGSWLLTDIEKSMLSTVRASFKKMVVVLNVGNIIDMSFVKEYLPDAVLYAWQGGMIGGLGTADVLTGVVSPSGKLTDTIANSLSDYPSDKNFGNPEIAIYEEDIFVGYRYFETFAQNNVLYPFGYGLSYTTFSIVHDDFVTTNTNGVVSVTFSVKVTNTGNFAGKEVVQVYCKQPQGLLGKPARVLTAFQKTGIIECGKSEKLTFTINLSDFASFDDTGITGHESCTVLEKGTYTFFVGSDVRSAVKCGSLSLNDLIIVEKLHKAMVNTQPINRIKAVASDSSVDFSDNSTDNDIMMKTEIINASESLQNKHRQQYLDSTDCTALIKKFPILDKLTDDDLCCIIRGEGMGSPKVTPGTCAAFGGVNEHLTSLGIPCGCCTDGPSGLRMDSGAQAFSMPNGTMCACSFNPTLLSELYYFTGLEMRYNKIDIILGPGMNIRRHPLNGRNFEYFSEDPYLTGIMASAIIKGLHNAGVTGSLKHFCGNNQEYGRLIINSVISERALREIYLKGFEITVKQGNADVVMTTYGAVNGQWTAGDFDLNTLILREEWGFKGIVMTDWWASINENGGPANKTNFAQMARSQNDLYMVCPDSSQNTHGDNTLQSLQNKTITRFELLRNAANIIDFVKKSYAQKRLDKTEAKIVIINRDEQNVDSQTEEIEYHEIFDGAVISLSDIPVIKGTSYSFGVSCKEPGPYHIELTGKTQNNQLAQISVGFSVNGLNLSSLTWNNTDNKWESKPQECPFRGRYAVLKLYFASNGLTLRDIKFIHDENVGV